MLGGVVRVLLIVAGVITGWFVARDAVNFGVLQLFVMLMMITVLIAGVAFWPMLISWFKGRNGPPNN